MFLFIYGLLSVIVGYFDGWLIGIGTFLAAWLVSFVWGMLNTLLPPMLWGIKHVVIIGFILFVLIVPNL